jgi:hypothetical protein
MILPGKMVTFVAETLNGSREATFTDENGITWRGDLHHAKCLVNGESRPTFAANALEGWADVRDEEKRGACSVTPDQPHGVPTRRIYGQVEILPFGPLNRINAALSGPAVALAREAVQLLRESADPKLTLAGRSLCPRSILANRLEKALNELTW